MTEEKVTNDSKTIEFLSSSLLVTVNRVCVFILIYIHGKH